jgi:hypothetical protein
MTATSFTTVDSLPTSRLGFSLDDSMDYRTAGTTKHPAVRAEARHGENFSSLLLPLESTCGPSGST